MNAFEIASDSDPFVKLVLILLIASSVLSWFVIFFKFMIFKQVSSQNKKFTDVFWEGDSKLSQVYQKAKNLNSSPVSKVFQAGYKEFRKVLGSKAGKEGEAIDTKAFSSKEVDIVMSNVDRAMRKELMGESMSLEKKVPILASIASVTPFVGLFGTVWGIMNSFSVMGQGGAGMLERIAPGIAEALIATAAGLGAAIPALVAYNYYVNRIRSYRAEMDSFSSDFSNILKRNFMG